MIAFIGLGLAATVAGGWIGIGVSERRFTAQLEREEARS